MGTRWKDDGLSDTIRGLCSNIRFLHSIWSRFQLQARKYEKEKRGRKSKRTVKNGTIQVAYMWNYPAKETDENVKANKKIELRQARILSSI